MLRWLAVLMGFQLLGELAVSALSLMFPGALLGMILLLGWLLYFGEPSEDLIKTSSGLIDLLGLFFVPAGSAIVLFGALMVRDGAAILAAIVISTAVSIAVCGTIASWPVNRFLARLSCHAVILRRRLQIRFSRYFVKKPISGQAYLFNRLRNYK